MNQSEEGSELYVVPLPAALSGKTFGETWRSFDCTVIGYIRPTTSSSARGGGGGGGATGHDIRISPPEADVVRAGDAVVLISRDIKQAQQMRSQAAEARGNSLYLSPAC